MISLSFDVFCHVLLFLESPKDVLKVTSLSKDVYYTFKKDHAPTFWNQYVYYLFGIVEKKPKNCKQNKQNSKEIEEHQPVDALQYLKSRYQFIESPMKITCKKKKLDYQETIQALKTFFMKELSNNSTACSSLIFKAVNREQSSTSLASLPNAWMKFIFYLCNNSKPIAYRRNEYNEDRLIVPRSFTVFNFRSGECLLYEHHLGFSLKHSIYKYQVHQKRKNYFGSNKNVEYDVTIKVEFKGKDALEITVKNSKMIIFKKSHELLFDFMCQVPCFADLFDFQDFAHDQFNVDHPLSEMAVSLFILLLIFSICEGSVFPALINTIDYYLYKLLFP